MNTLGSIFKVSSFGESHGSHVGVVLNGCPAGLSIDLEKIQTEVDRRKTARAQFASSRIEADIVDIISGVFKNKTTGGPIAILIRNKDARSKDYDLLEKVYRPGHADFTNQLKYGHRDHRGGGRASIRITAAMVAAGEIARQYLSHVIDSYRCDAFVSGIGQAQFDTEKVFKSGLSEEHLKKRENSLYNLIDDNFEINVVHELDEIIEEKDTLGGAISCLIEGMPLGVGEPIFGKLQAQLGHALFSINTVKAVEFGRGKEASRMKGSEHNDAFEIRDDVVRTKTNNHGGILGGISTGERIYFSAYFKPISSIGKEQQTVDTEGNEVSLEIRGRHDLCAVPRAVPIVEAYSNIILADLYLKNKLCTLEQ